MTEKIVELIRRFTPMSSRSEECDFLTADPGRPRRWHEIEDEHHILIIAAPGAGKTFEARNNKCNYGFFPIKQILEFARMQAFSSSFAKN